MSAVNAEIRLLADRLGEPLDWAWPFVCECGDPDCDEPVLCSLVVYDDVKNADGAILAQGHALTRARAVRAQSAAIREESLAVRAQAEQQLRRLQRLRPLR